MYIFLMLIFCNMIHDYLYLYKVNLFISYLLQVPHLMTLEDHARTNNLRCINVSGDGNCFYNAVSLQLTCAGMQCGKYNILPHPP